MSGFLNERLQKTQQYVPGEQPGDGEYIKLNTNESPFPPAPGVCRLFNAGLAERLRLYPDPTARRLTDSLARECGVNAENVFICNGSDEALSFAFMALFEDGVAFPDVSYGFYEVYAELYGMPYVKVPLREDLSIDVGDYTDIDKNIVIANPNAPTGIELPLCDIERLLKEHEDRVVLIDEAYIDFGGSSCAELIKKYKNLLVVQTYSKSRCMAGARLGFAIADSALTDDLMRIKFSTNPYNINTVTLAAGEAALGDRAYFEKCVSSIKETRAYTAGELKKLGFVMTESKANFLFARHPDIGGETLYKELKKRRVLVRWLSGERTREYTRITIGTREQMDALINAVKDILKENANA